MHSDKKDLTLKAALAALGASLGVAMVPVAQAADGSVKPAEQKAIKQKAQDAKSVKLKAGDAQAHKVTAKESKAVKLKAADAKQMKETAAKK